MSPFSHACYSTQWCQFKEKKNNTGSSLVHLKCREETLDALQSLGEYRGFLDLCGGKHLCWASWGVQRWRDVSVLHEWLLAQRELPSFPASLSGGGPGGGGPLSCFQLKMESCPFKQLLTEGKRGVAGKEDTLRRERGGCCLCKCSFITCCRGGGWRGPR